MKFSQGLLIAAYHARHLPYQQDRETLKQRLEALPTTDS